jgi:hypothetical protein
VALSQSRLPAGLRALLVMAKRARHQDSPPPEGARDSAPAPAPLWTPIAPAASGAAADAWSPAELRVAMNVEIDLTRDVICAECDARARAPRAAPLSCRAGPQARRADAARSGSREDRCGRIVVLDGLFGEPERAALLAFITAPDWDHTKGARHRRMPRTRLTRRTLAGPPEDKWERRTSDGPGFPLSWGLKDQVRRPAHTRAAPCHGLRSACACALQYLQQLHAHPVVRRLGQRLQTMYPEVVVALQPPNSTFAGEAAGDGPRFACDQFVVNAPL